MRSVTVFIKTSVINFVESALKRVLYRSFSNNVTRHTLSQTKNSADYVGVSATTWALIFHSKRETFTHYFSQELKWLTHYGPQRLLELLWIESWLILIARTWNWERKVRFMCLKLRFIQCSSFGHWQRSNPLKRSQFCRVLGYSKEVPLIFDLTQIIHIYFSISDLDVKV